MIVHNIPVNEKCSIGLSDQVELMLAGGPWKLARRTARGIIHTGIKNVWNN
jgi:hypothetical protein